MRAVGLVLTIAAAGCYNPSLQPCEIACANRECPDGLVCNGQNACALSSTATCDQLPIDAPNDGSGTSVTIEVRNGMGEPLAAALVVFLDSAGSQVAETLTGADGMASFELPAGGSATVIRTIARPGVPGTDLHASTYLDLWPGAHIISQAEIDQRTRTVTFILSPPTNTSVFTVFTSCAGSPALQQPTIAVEIPLRCPTFDVIATAGNPASPTMFAAVLAAKTGPTVMVTDVDFKPIRMLSGMLTGLPTNTANRLIGTSGWVTATLPASSRTISSTTPGPTGMIGPLAVPADAGIQTQLVLQHQPMAGGPMLQQIVIDRLPATSIAINRDYNATLVQWAGAAAFDPQPRRLSWPFYVPTGTTPTVPSFFAASVAYNHDPSMGVSWQLVGDASRITTTGATQSITFPDLPGMPLFEPTGADVVTNDVVTLVGTESQAVHDLREILEAEGVDIGYFKIPTLRHLTVSVGP